MYKYFNQLTESDWPVDSLLIPLLSVFLIIFLLKFAVITILRLHRWYNNRERNHGLRAHYALPNPQAPIQEPIYCASPQPDDLAALAGSSRSGARFDEADYRLVGHRYAGPRYYRPRHVRPRYAQVVNAGEETYSW